MALDTVCLETIDHAVEIEEVEEKQGTTGPTICLEDSSLNNSFTNLEEGLTLTLRVQSQVNNYSL